MMNLSVDGGGTKIAAVLFDGDFNPVASGLGGGINANVVGAAAAEQSMRGCIESCLSGLSKPVIGRLAMAMCGDQNRFLSILREYADVRDAVTLSEGHMSLLAGLRRPYGALAQAGTGSFAFVRDSDGAEHSIGGYGWIFGDEGSGGWIGRKGITAVLQAKDGLGEPTIISDILLDIWGLRHIRQLIEAVYGAPIPVMKAASACPVVCEAARRGDAVAVRICHEAGVSLARQMNALLTRHPSRDVTVGGSAWKGNLHMFGAFCRDVRAAHPGAVITLPAFEPVMGGVFLEANRRRIALDEGIVQRNYAAYRINNTAEEAISC